MQTLPPKKEEAQKHAKVTSWAFSLPFFKKGSKIYLVVETQKNGITICSASSSSSIFIKTQKNPPPPYFFLQQPTPRPLKTFSVITHTYQRPKGLNSLQSETRKVLMVWGIEKENGVCCFSFSRDPGGGGGIYLPTFLSLIY